HFVKDGDLNLIEYLLEKGVSPALQDAQEKNIIFYLSERVEKAKSEQEIKHLTKLIDMALRVKDSLGQKDKKGNNLLIGFLNTLNKPLSSYNQKSFLSTLISKFIKSGVDINEKNNEGENALFLSVDKNDLDTVILLLDNDANINMPNANQETPLSNTILKGNNEYLEMVRLLLSSKANPNLKDPAGVCIFEKIIYILLYINKLNLKEETTDVPMEENEDIDIEKFNEDDFIRTIFELIVAEQLIDFDTLDSQGNPYFFILVFSENNYFSELLFKAGANINQINHDNKNILEYYIDFVKENEVDENTVKKIIKNIVKFGIDLSKTDEQGATMLHNTILKEPLAMTRNMIGVGASINVTDKKGRTLLHNAVWANDIEKVRFVIGIKKDLLNIPDKLGIMPINYAVFFGNKELTYYLLSINGYVNNLHEKQKSTLDFFRRFHKNVLKLETEENALEVKNRQLLTLLVNMKKEFMIVD
ncbi:MAG: ankyrin repeat domain-containing protein, partial [Campylobacteraceae bacterium]|nr:ankyrin repeat domain-containing protein [Campylobacteraceae bacterium]